MSMPREGSSLKKKKKKKKKTMTVVAPAYKAHGANTHNLLVVLLLDTVFRCRLLWF